LRYKVDLNLRNKKQLTPLEIVANDEIATLLTKAKRFELINKLSLNKPSKAIQEAENRLFRASGDESD